MYVRIKILVTITKALTGEVIRFGVAHEIKVSKSIDKIGSSASIKIPASARMVYNGIATESVQTAKVFGRGDKIQIEAGYEDRLREEFNGFIKVVDLVSPCEIVCEGYEYLLDGSLDTKSFKNTTIEEIVTYIAKVDGITIAEMPNMPFDSFIIPANITRIEALQQLKEKYPVTIYFIDNVLYCGLDFIQFKGDVKYSIGYNTPKADELKYQLAKDVKIKIKAEAWFKNNTKIEAEVGDNGGELRSFKTINTVNNKEDLEKLAMAEIQKYKFDGYVGKLTSFLEPFAMPTMVAHVNDMKFTERGGRYEIRSVETTIGTSGGRRHVEIGKVLS